MVGRLHYRYLQWNKDRSVNERRCVDNCTTISLDNSKNFRYWESSLIRNKTSNVNRSSMNTDGYYSYIIMALLIRTLFLDFTSTQTKEKFLPFEKTCKNKIANKPEQLWQRRQNCHSYIDIRPVLWYIVCYTVHAYYNGNRRLISSVCDMTERI